AFSTAFSVVLGSSVLASAFASAAFGSTTFSSAVTLAEAGVDLISPVTTAAGLGPVGLSSGGVVSAALAGVGSASDLVVSVLVVSGFASSTFAASALAGVASPDAAAGAASDIVTAALAGSTPLASAVWVRAWPTVERSSSFTSAVSVDLPTSRVASAPLSDFTPSGASTCGASSAIGCGATFCVISS